MSNLMIKNKKNQFEYQIKRKSKKQFIKERNSFLRFYLIIFLVLGLFFVIIKLKFLFFIIGVPLLLSMFLNIREMNKNYKNSPISIDIGEDTMTVHYETNTEEITLKKLDYVSQFFTRHKYGIYNKSIFQGSQNGMKFWLVYEYLENSHLIQKFFKEKWIDKKDASDLEYLKAKSKEQKVEEKKIRHIHIHHIRSISLSSSPYKEYVELHIFNKKNKVSIFKYQKNSKDLAAIIIKCYRLQSMNNILFESRNQSYISYFKEDIKGMGDFFV